ncbi:hypothetical protein H2199_001527 [Coniosporium tulheliwenetii]|uniref:Uncharacterized protein n=1 Tax=Coniosporium tulheliwenetii TaxID=3383036 RepID=A0ACC2ZJR5_9PEZI|nr:hypothetical protein H2199_001527 [Cladosporium sp. JES 115]
MGRKPNPLILEYFERGAKLEDSSNRYQHTCKSCGEKFPKGRIDSLTAHLVKKCPALSLQDRQRAILQFHELPNLAPLSADVANAMSAMQRALQNEQTTGMSALETLAEVSRQRLDLNGQNANLHAGGGGRRLSVASVGQPTGFTADDFLVEDDKRHVFADSSGFDPSIQTHYDTSGAPPLPSIHLYGGAQPSLGGSPHLPGLSLPPSSAPTAQMVPSPLQMAASAASELQQAMMPNNGLTMEPELEVPNAGISDKFFHPQRSSPSAWPNMSNIDPLLQGNGVEAPAPQPQEQVTDPMPQRPRALAANPLGLRAQLGLPAHFTTDFSINQKPAKPKVRGRFSDSRRKEVQEVRKRGACLRCRMLKKPCSGDSPCNTCQNVESARLWKAPCIRTRVAEEFTLYSAGLHAVQAFHAVGQVKAQIPFASVPGRIEATHFPETSTYITFTVLKGRRAEGSALDPALFDGNSRPNEFAELEIVDTDSDDVSGKIEQYIKRMTPTFCETESSSFMSPTLTQAYSMSQNSKVRSSSVLNDLNLRSKQDRLLISVLELWIATRILVDPDLRWQFFSNPALPPSMAPATMIQEDINASSSTSHPRRPIDPATQRDSYDLIHLQLRAATEKRAANLSKFVMNDIERRLLQRQQANPFETFLVAVILLACVERMCWYFKTWEDSAAPPSSMAEANGSRPQPGTDSVDANIPPNSQPPLAQQLQQHAEQAQQQHQPSSSAAPPPPPPAHAEPQPRPPQPSHRPPWPLDKPPPHYSQQVERFSDILHMLLRMRGVPPKTVTAPSSEPGNEGILTVAGEDADPAARQWFESVGVSERWVAERRDARFEGVAPGEWEGKYVGKILLGAGG